jgi:hypothetical protein
MMSLIAGGLFRGLIDSELNDVSSCRVGTPERSVSILDGREEVVSGSLQLLLLSLFLVHLISLGAVCDCVPSA